MCQILGDFQTIQHYTDKHIVIFNQNASHRASLLKKTLPGGIFLQQMHFLRLREADQTVNLQGIRGPPSNFCLRHRFQNRFDQFGQ